MLAIATPYRTRTIPIDSLNTIILRATQDKQENSQDSPYRFSMRRNPWPPRMVAAPPWQANAQARIRAQLNRSTNLLWRLTDINKQYVKGTILISINVVSLCTNINNDAIDTALQYNNTCKALHVWTESAQPIHATSSAARWEQLYLWRHWHMLANLRPSNGKMFERYIGNTWHGLS